MSKNPWRLTLSHPWYSGAIDDGGKPKELYKVEKVVNSIAFTPGQCLEKAHVGHLCENPDWYVEVIAPRSK